MKIIEKVVDLIGEELHDARKYIKLAMKETEHSSLSECFAALAEEEMGHAKRLHAEAEKLIAEYKEKNGEPPVEMLAVYNYMHKKQVEKAVKIRRMIDDYRSR